VAAGGVVLCVCGVVCGVFFTSTTSLKSIGIPRKQDLGSATIIARAIPSKLKGSLAYL
jgi:hypothetical protein